MPDNPNVSYFTWAKTLRVVVGDLTSQWWWILHSVCKGNLREMQWVDENIPMLDIVVAFCTGLYQDGWEYKN